MYSSSVIMPVPFQSVVLGRRQAGGAMTTQGGFPCVGGAPEATSTAKFDDHLSRDSLITDTGRGPTAFPTVRREQLGYANHRQLLSGPGRGPPTRLHEKYAESHIDHYLDFLADKPGPLPDLLALQ
jgi:hypothetical protein